MAPVDGVGLVVVGGEGDGIGETGSAGLGTTPDIPGVKGGEGGSVHLVVADAVEEIDKGLVLLAVDGGELDGDVVEALEGFAVEEIGRGVDALHKGAFALGNHRRQLVYVADHQQLYTAERAAVATIAPEGGVDSVEQVGSHHRNLVDDKQLERAYDAHFGLVQPLAGFGHLIFGDQLFDVGKVGVERQLEERVDGDAAGVHRGDARGGDHDMVLLALGVDIAQEGGLPGACFPGKE